MIDDDATAVRRAQHGDRDAFGVLVTRYADRVFGYLARAADDTDEAGDLLQETLIRAWRGLPRYVHTGRFESWLFSIARHLVTDRGRRLQRVRQLDVTASEVYGGPTPLESAEHIELQSDLAAALDGLSLERKQVFLMRQHSTMTYREIADTLGIPLGTALSHMHHAVRTLKETLKHHEP